MSLLLALLLSGAPVQQGVQLYDEGAPKGWAVRVNCIGSGVACYMDAGVGTVNVGVPTFTGAGVTTTTDGGSTAVYIDAGHPIEFTTEDRTYFVNASTGNDAYDCLDAGSPCLTVPGGLSKIPHVLRHNATLKVAAGSYAGFVVSGFTVDLGTQHATSGLLIDGDLGNVTPATGTATGTATAGTAGTWPLFGTLTDGAQAWTVNDLVGALVVKTGGTGVGEVGVISANTATVITISAAWTAPTGSTTYAIQKPTTIITSVVPAIPNAIGNAVGSAGILSAGVIFTSNNMPAIGAYMRNLRFQTGGTIALRVAGFQRVDLTQVISDNGGISYSDGARGTILASAASCSASCVSTSFQAVVTLLKSLVLGTSGAIRATAGSSLQIFEGQLKVTGANGACASIAATATQPSYMSVGNARCDCASASPSYGVSAGDLSAAGIDIGPSLLFLSNMDVTNCTYGAAAYGGVTISSNNTGNASLSGNALTYGVDAQAGASIVLRGPTITAGTAEISLDRGATTATFASIPAAGNCVVSLTTLSKVCRR